MTSEHHSYEEIRAVSMDILAHREAVNHEPSQYGQLVTGVAEVLARRSGMDAHAMRQNLPPRLSASDAEVFLEVFWGLFRDGIITLGLNDSNREFPFFRPTRFGVRLGVTTHSGYFFHDVQTYTDQIKKVVPDLQDTTLLYLQEAMQAFLSSCLLSATVMLGVAAEHSFELLLDAAIGKVPWKDRLAGVGKERTVLARIRKFQNVLEQHLADVPPSVKEDLDTHFAGILAVIRTSRNEAGHPTGKILSREQAYVLLHLFIEYAKKTYQLRAYFAA